MGISGGGFVKYAARRLAFADSGFCSLLLQAAEHHEGHRHALGLHESGTPRCWCLFLYGHPSPIPLSGRATGWVRVRVRAG
jgi:hypothetical protein